MKLTDLIRLLNEELAQHGDVDVHLDGHGWEATSVEYAISINDVLDEYAYVIIHSQVAETEDTRELIGV